MQWNGRRVLFKTLYGSHLYGLNTEKSDKDFKGVVVPTRQELEQNLAPYTSYESQTKVGTGKNTAADQDLTYFTLKAFLRLCEEGQTVALEMLFAPPEMWEYASSEWQELVCNRHLLVHKNVTAFFGYARKQADRYSNKGDRIKAMRVLLEWTEQKPMHRRASEFLPDLQRLVQENQHLRSSEDLPLLDWSTKFSPHGQPLLHLSVCNREWPVTNTVKYLRQQVQKALNRYGERALKAESEGGDWKALSHALRLGYQCLELLESHKLTLPLPEDVRQHLLAVKLGHVSRQEVEEEFEGYLLKIQKATQDSTLPEKADKNFMDKFLEREYNK